MEKVDFSPQTREHIKSAIEDILKRRCSRVDINPDVKVYACKNVIRVDLKITEDE